jgi:hypothetical protein
MSGESKISVLKRLREQVTKGKLADDVSIVYRLHGGAPGKQQIESVLLTADGRTRVSVADSIGSKSEGTATNELGPKAVLDLASTIVLAVDDLIPASQAQFLPDSLVGSVSIGFGDDVETYYFDADEDAPENKGVSSLTKSFGKIEAASLKNSERHELLEGSPS